MGTGEGGHPSKGVDYVEAAALRWASLSTTLEPDFGCTELRQECGAGGRTLL